MTFEERVWMASVALAPTAFEPLKGHGEGQCPDCDYQRDEARKQARRALLAAFPDLYGEKPTHEIREKYPSRTETRSLAAVGKQSG